MSKELKEYKEAIKILHDSINNNVIDIYKEKQQVSKDEEIIYDALIDFYLKMKQAMDITCDSMENVYKKLDLII